MLADILPTHAINVTVLATELINKFTALLVTVLLFWAMLWFVRLLLRRLRDCLADHTDYYYDPRDYRDGHIQSAITPRQFVDPFEHPDDFDELDEQGNVVRSWRNGEQL